MSDIKLSNEDIRALSDDELKSKSTELGELLWKTKMENFTNQLDDTNLVRRVRRDVARVKTEISARAKKAQA